MEYRAATWPCTAPGTIYQGDGIRVAPAPNHWHVKQRWTYYAQ